MNGLHVCHEIGHVLGACVPAQVTAAGMLMLAPRSAAELADWVAKRELCVYTPNTNVT